MVRSSSWVPANEPVVLAGYRIAGGLIYFGRSCRSAAGTTEPAQINPGLPVDPPPTVRPVHDLGQAPAYHLISATHRAAYLRWLARGRTGDDVPLGLLHLFCSGLERRVLLDARTEPAARDEFGVIAAELHRLRDLYGQLHAGFGPRVTALLEVLELLTATPRPPFPLVTSVPPPVVPDAPRWPVPPALRIRLAQLANVGLPVPPDWARCWAWYHPALFPTMPQTRCPQEFDRLFALRYRRQLPAGITPAGDGRPPVRIGYLPINPAMDTVVVERPELPDVLEEPAATRQLAAVVAEVSSALTPYSRWLGRTPGGRNSVASTVLLPDDLLQDEPGPLRPLLDWASSRLGTAATTVIDAGEFAPFWSSADPRRMSRDEATSLAVVLARLGLGVEPDARFGGPALGSGPAVLFRLGRQGAGDGTTAPSAAFRSAGHVLAVVAAVWPGVADLARPRSDPKTNSLAPKRPIAGRDALVNRTVTALAAEVRLSVDERTRLGARLRWLLAAGVDPQQVRRRAAALTGEQRETGVQVLLRLAVEAGPVGPEMVAALAAGYRLLGLPEDQLYPQLHQATTEQHGPRPPVRPTQPTQPTRVTRVTRVEPTLPARAAVFPEPIGVPEPVPVLARRGRQGDAGHPLPWALNTAADPSPDRPGNNRRNPDRPSSHQRGVGEETGIRLQLRPELIGRRQAETEAVSALLAEVFAADTDAANAANAANAAASAPPGPGQMAGTAPAASTAPAAGLIPELDTRHHGLLAELASRSSWTGKELDTLAAGFGVLPAGALDLLNEVAIERTGQLLVEVDTVIDAGAAGSADDEGDENDERNEVLTVDVTVARELLR